MSEEKISVERQIVLQNLIQGEYRMKEKIFKELQI